MNISKFTQKSVQAVQNCEKLAYTYGHQEIDVEHLLLSLYDLEDSLIKKLLTKMDVEESAFRQSMEQSLNRRPKVSGGNLYLSADLNKVLLNAEDEAKRMGDQYVSVEHLFLGLLDSANVVLAQFFRTYNVTKEKVMQA